MYFPDKDFYFKRDIWGHILIVSLPWLVIGWKWRLPKRKYLTCFCLELVTHWFIDVNKTKYRKRV